MDPKTLRIAGIICFVACCVLLFVAYERYQANAGNVRAMNQMRQSTPLGDMMGNMEMKPAPPAATKYAILFAVISAATAVLCFVLAGRQVVTPGNETTTDDTGTAQADC